MKRTIYLTLMLIGLMAACILTGCSSSGPKLENVELDKGNKYNCTFEDVKHDFVISLPEQTKNAPLIVMLHGASDSAENFRLTSRFDEDALPKGYAVCYATGTVNVKAGRSEKSWNYGRMDPDYNDVGFIKALVNYLVDEYSLDEDRVFCAGFSNGGFMNFRLALEAQDTFQACVSVGGDLCKTLWNKKPEKNDVGMLAIIGEIDESVPKNFDGTAKTALDPAIEDVLDYMATSNGLELQSEAEIGEGSTIRKYGADGDEDVRIKSGANRRREERRIQFAWKRRKKPCGYCRQICRQRGNRRTDVRIKSGRNGKSVL